MAEIIPDMDEKTGCFRYDREIDYPDGRGSRDRMNVISASRLATGKLYRRLALFILSALLPATLRARESFASDFTTGTALPAGCSATGVWQAVSGQTSVRVPAAAAPSTGNRAAVDAGTLQAGRGLGTFTVETRFRLGGSSSSGSSVAALLFVPANVPFGPAVFDSPGASLQIRIREQAGKAYYRVQTNPLDTWEWEMPAGLLTKNGPVVTLSVTADLKQKLIGVSVNGELYSQGYFPDNFETAGSRVTALFQSSTTRFYDLLRLSASGTLWTGQPVIIEQPQTMPLRFGYVGELRVRANDPLVSTYQWQRRTPADAGFLNFSGVGSTTPSLPFSAGDTDATRYRCVISTPTGQITSQAVAVTKVDTEIPLTAPLQLNFNGSTAVPTGTGASSAFLTGGAHIFTGGMDGNSAALTTGAQGQSGALIVNDLNGAAGESGFVARFRVRVNGGTSVPADGFSFSWGRNIPDSPPQGAWEEGLGSDLRIAFDLYDNGGGEAPAVDIYWRDRLIAHSSVPPATLYSGSNWMDVGIRVSSAGIIDVAINKQVIHWGAIATIFWSNLSGARFAIAARTGILTAAIAIDEVGIQPWNAVAAPVITVQPSPTVALVGGRAAFTIGLADPANAMIRWRKLTSQDSTDLAFGSSTTLLLDPVPNSLFAYDIVADVFTAGGTVTSRPARLSLAGANAMSVKRSFSFAEPSVPQGTAVRGTAAWVPSPREGEGASIRLTGNQTGELGAFTVPAFDSGRLVAAMIAEFEVQVKNWTNPPADGWSFVWSPDLPAAPFGEEGAGTGGLIVSFDTFDNNEGFPSPEAPEITVYWKGQRLAGVSIPIAELLTAEDWAPVHIFVSRDGRLSVNYRSLTIFRDLQLPGYAGLANAGFGWGARTGMYTAAHSVRRIRLGTAKAVPEIDIRAQNGGFTITFEGILIREDGQVMSTQSPYSRPFPPEIPDFEVPEPRRLFYRAVVP